MVHKKRPIRSATIHKSVFQSLKVELVSNAAILTDHILPYLPYNIIPHKESYQSMIAAVSHILHQEFPASEESRRLEFLHNLRHCPLAADMKGVLHMASDLFDHEDALFSAALGSNPEAALLLDEVRPFGDLWKALGLRHRANGLLETEDYVFCLRSLTNQLRASEGVLADAKLLSDAQEILLPLTSSVYDFGHFTRDDWRRVSQNATFPALTNMEHQPMYRRVAMVELAEARPLIPLSEAISAQYMPLSWSQTSYPFMQPSPAAFGHSGDMGKPPMAMVWRHLEHMTKCAKDLTQQAVPDFLADLYGVYAYLQGHIEAARSEFSLQESYIWLNLDLAEPALVTVDDIRSSWHSIENINL